MCGISGLIDLHAQTRREDLLARAGAMATALSHRGPDRQGIWVEEAYGIALGHRRLSILDLSPLGDQPMQSRDARYVLAFNGEIYNFRELRAELAGLGHEFRGSSDTEVMLAALTQWGPEAALQRFEGMFAFALWDRQERELWLARDRLGEKPLYYGWYGQYFVFASELKALRTLPAFKPSLNREASRLYFQQGFIPAPLSIYEGIFKLPAASFLRIQIAEPAARPDPLAYWRLLEVVSEARKNPFQGTDSEAVHELERLLTQSVKQRMDADVPIGAFLSGGIDSSLVVALMQRQSPRPVHTFTIGFEKPEYNEASRARATAERLGTRHSERILTAAEALGVIPLLPSIYDEPFADPSQIATYLVAKHARTEVTVCLSGDAGDEFFAGYHRHFWGDRIWRGLERLPRAARVAAAAVLRQVPARTWQALGQATGNPRAEIFAEQLGKLLKVLPSRNPRELYLRLVSHLDITRSAEAARPQAPGWPALGSVMADFQYQDAMNYLPDDILTKIDRATMAVGLEARVPFLDSAVIRFAWSLPDSMKVRAGEGKWLLRRLLERYLPSDSIPVAKAGFDLPIADWLRGPLRDWSENLLSEAHLPAQGFLKRGEVRKLWKEHLSGRCNHRDRLWDILMWQAWHAENP